MRPDASALNHFTPFWRFEKRTAVKRIVDVKLCFGRDIGRGSKSRVSEFLHDILNFEGSRDLSRVSFLLRDLRAAKTINTQDQQ
jgi:hypothetical protein